MKKFRVWLASGAVADIVADSITCGSNDITFKNAKGDVIACFGSFQGWAESKNLVEEVYL